MKEIIKKNSGNLSIIGIITVAKLIALQSYLNTSFNEFYMRKKAMEFAKTKAGEPSPLLCDSDNEYEKHFTFMISLVNALSTVYFLFRAFTSARRAGETNSSIDLFMSVLSLAMLLFLDSCWVPRLENNVLAERLGTYDGYKLATCQDDCDKYNHDKLVGFGGIPKEYSMGALVVLGFFSAAAVGRNYWVGAQKRQPNNHVNEKLNFDSRENENDAVAQITL